MTLKVGDDLGNGWTVAHVQDAKAVSAGGPGTATITVTDANIEAHHRSGASDHLQVLMGSSEEELKDRIDYWNNTQPNPDPTTEDGNRPMTREEKLESARATALMHVTIGARVGAEADLTEPADKPTPEAAIIQVQPTVEVEEVSGEKAAGIVAAAQGKPVPEPEADDKKSSKKS